MDEHDNPGRLLSREEAIAYLGGAPVTDSTIAGLIRRRELAFVRVGRATRFRRAALDAYIDAHTVHAEPNAWGLTDASLARIREGRAERRSKAS